MLLLAVESSCDETSAAVVRNGAILSTVVSSQAKLHLEYGGVVPELAAREHLRNLIPAVAAALRKAGVSPSDLDAVAATRGPGLPSAIMAGFQFAKAMAWSLQIPCLGVHHHEAHLYSPWIDPSPPAARFDLFQPNISLIVSGGHTLLVHVKSPDSFEVLGGTVDDAAGECFDKTAKLIGLPYPGGPQLEKLAREGSASAHNFPRPMLHDPHFDFSFSGLKTSIRYHLRDHPETLKNRAALADVCASAQSAIVEVLVAKTIRAALKCSTPFVTASGGVTCNQFLRGQLEAACRSKKLQLRMAAPEYCTDNAAMVAVLAERRLGHGAAPEPPGSEALPAWRLGQKAPELS